MQTAVEKAAFKEKAAMTFQKELLANGFCTILEKIMQQRFWKKIFEQKHDFLSQFVLKPLDMWQPKCVDEQTRSSFLQSWGQNSHVLA